MYKYYSEAIKKKIVKRYLNGESITNLSLELWQNSKAHNHRKNIYGWISKYGNKNEISIRKSQRKNKIRKPKVIYSIDLKYNTIMKYLNGESALKLAKELWPNKNPYNTKSFIFCWKKELESKILF